MSMHVFDMLLPILSTLLQKLNFPLENRTEIDKDTILGSKIQDTFNREELKGVQPDTCDGVTDDIVFSFDPNRHLI